MAPRPDRRRFAIAALAIAAIAIAAYVLTRSSGGDRAGGDGKSGASSADGTDRDDPWARGGAGRKGAGRGTPIESADIVEGVPVVVEGTVRDAFSHAPTGGVDVEFVSASPSGPGPEYTATSAADGSYRIEITSGAWNVRARGDGLWALPLRLLIAPAPGGGAVSHDVLVQRAATISGRVLSAKGAAMPGAVVSVESQDRAVQAMLDDMTGRSIAADGGGRFELTVPPGEARLRAEVTGGDGAVRAGFALVPSIAPGAKLTIDIVVPDGVTVSGIVVDADESPVAGAIISVTSRDPTVGGRQRLSGESDAGGHFRLVGVYPGALTVEAHNDAGASAPTSVRVRAGEAPAEVVLTLEDALPLTGTVVDSSGEPVEYARVNVTLSHSDATIPPVHTASDGKFAFAGTIAGTYDVRVKTGAQVVTQTFENTGAPITVTLAALGGIRGVVKGGATDLTVTVETFVPAGESSPSRAAVASASFTGNGEFVLANLAPGRYDLVVGARDHAPTRVPDVIVGDGKWAEVGVELESGARVSGTVTDGNGAVAGARVTVQGGRLAYTDTQGRFAIDAVPLGPVTITIADDQHPAAERSAVVGPDGATVAIVLPAEGGRDVEGIGVLLTEQDHAISVVKVARGAPAWNQVPPGAVIAAVDGIEMSSVAAALARIRGAAGTQVTLTLAQGDRRWDVTLTRARVTVGWSRPYVA